MAAIRLAWVVQWPDYRPDYRGVVANFGLLRLIAATSLAWVVQSVRTIAQTTSGSRLLPKVWLAMTYCQTHRVLLGGAIPECPADPGGVVASR